MTGDLGEGEQALVDLKLQDLRFQFTKSNPWSKSIELSLQSLIMEDLLQVSTDRLILRVHALGQFSSPKPDIRVLCCSQ